MAKLGECFSVIRNGASIRQTDGAGGFPITRIETIADKTINREKFGYAGIYDLAQYRDYILQDGDILMSHINSEKHLGKVALYSKQDDEQIIHGMNLLMLRADAQKVIPEYAKYYFESQKFLRQIGRITKKSVNQASFTVTALKELEIPLASIIVQRDISEKLKKVDWLVSLRKQQLAKLDELVKARFVEMFGDPQSNSKGWPLDTLNNIISTIESGWSGNGKQREKTPDEIAVLKVSSVTKGYFIPTECKVLDDQSNIKKYVFPQKGDILFSRANTKEMVGATALITQDYPDLILPDKLWKIRFAENINVFYMKSILSSKSIRDRFSAESTGTSGSMYNVSMEKFRAITVPIPPFSLQNEFAVFVECVDQQKQTVQQSLEKLELMKKALMQEYFG